jgi:hypothetical protein
MQDVTIRLQLVAADVTGARNSQSAMLEITLGEDLRLQVSAADTLPKPTHRWISQCGHPTSGRHSGCGTLPSVGLQFDPDRGMVAGLLPPSDVMIDLRIRQSSRCGTVQEKMIEP